MKHPLMILVLVLVLVACGQPSFAEGEQTIRGYADVVKAGDLTTARTLISNPSIDWKETTERLLGHGVASYTLRDLVQTEIGYAATIIWQPADDSAPFCSYVRVRKESGALEMVKDGTFICPDTITAPAP
jgi:hypothetical protein